MLFESKSTPSTNVRIPEPLGGIEDEINENTPNYYYLLDPIFIM